MRHSIRLNSTSSGRLARRISRVASCCSTTCTSVSFSHSTSECDKCDGCDIEGGIVLLNHVYLSQLQSQYQ